MLTSSSNGALSIECGWGIKVDASIVWPSGFFCFKLAYHKQMRITMEKIMEAHIKMDQ